MPQSLLTLKASAISTKKLHLYIKTYNLWASRNWCPSCNSMYLY